MTIDELIGKAMSGLEDANGGHELYGSHVLRQFARELLGLARREVVDSYDEIEAQFRLYSLIQQLKS